jgi:hypothetical protein
MTVSGRSLLIAWRQMAVELKAVARSYSGTVQGFNTFYRALIEVIDEHELGDEVVALFELYREEEVANV